MPRLKPETEMERSIRKADNDLRDMIKVLLGIKFYLPEDDKKFSQVKSDIILARRGLGNLLNKIEKASSIGTLDKVIYKK